jgi:hypothetical protein
MSHFTTVQTKIKDLVCLKRTLGELGIECTESTEEQRATVKGYQGQTTDAVMSIHISKSYDVGVKVDEDGHVQFVADWWGVETTRGWTEEEFLQKITQKYSYNKVVEEVQKRGFTVEEEETDEDETIHIKVSSWQ